VGTNANVNANNDTYVAYCFAAVAGYSAFGKYTGNGSADGPFVFTGFRPRFVMIKRTDSNGGGDPSNWWIMDDVRTPSNGASGSVQYLVANSSDAELTRNRLEMFSNGFKLTNNFDPWNANGGTFIFMAIAETPQKFALAR
jgi:hypothetical protein